MQQLSESYVVSTCLLLTKLRLRAYSETSSVLYSTFPTVSSSQSNNVTDFVKFKIKKFKLISSCQIRNYYSLAV